MSRELVRRKSSVRPVRIVERRVVWAFRVDMWDWVCDAMDDRDGC